MRPVGRHPAGTPPFILALAVAAALALAACAGGGETTAASPTPATSTGPIVVTFEVDGDQRFKVLLTHPDDIATARELLAGGDAPGIPDGRIVHTTGVNAGWSWSIDPEDIRFTDETNEDCDGSPSGVESGEISGDRYCPSDAVVVAIDPAR